MPDHLHALISFHDDQRMDQTIRDWKRFIAKRTTIQWLAGFFDHSLRDAKSFDEKAAYIRMNPVRARIVSEPFHWPFVWTADPVQPAR